MSPSGRTVLVVDDQAEMLRGVRQLLEREGHHVLAAASGGKALAFLADHAVDLCLVDYLMPVVHGELLLRAIRERDHAVPIVLLTARTDTPPRAFLQRFAILGCHDRQDGHDRLLRSVEVAFEAQDQRARLKAADTVATRAGDIQQALSTALDGLRIAQELVAEFGATLAAMAVPIADHRQRLAAELTMVLAKVDQWTRTAASAAGASLGRNGAVGQGDWSQRLTNELPALLREQLHLAEEQVVVRVDPELPAATGEWTRLTEALVRLLADDEDGAERHIAIDVTAAGRQIALAVTDRGRSSDPTVGLSVAQCIVSVDFGGDLSRSESPPGETRFVLRLPLAGHKRPAEAPAEQPATDVANAGRRRRTAA